MSTIIALQGRTRGATVVVRIPVIPGINTDDDNTVQAARSLAALPGIRRVELLSYHNSARKKYRQLGIDYIPADVAKPGPERLKAMAAILQAHGLNVHTGEKTVNARITQLRRESLEAVASISAERARPVTRYAVTAGVIECYRDEIIPYWRGRSMRERVFGRVPRNWR